MKTAPRQFDEAAFRRWYQERAQRLGLNPDPDDPRHFYDYRAAYQAGAEPDASGHWPSAYKRTGHPRMIVDGVNTKTGERVEPPALPRVSPDIEDRRFAPKPDVGRALLHSVRNAVLGWGDTPAAPHPKLGEAFDPLQLALREPQFGPSTPPPAWTTEETPALPRGFPTDREGTDRMVWGRLNDATSRYTGYPTTSQQAPYQPAETALNPSQAALLSFLYTLGLERPPMGGHLLGNPITYIPPEDPSGPAYPPR